MKSIAGQRLVQQLAAAADVVVENFLPGAATKMNISYDHVRALNPRAIYVSISGYGSSGPLAHHPVRPPPLTSPTPSPRLPPLLMLVCLGLRFHGSGSRWPHAHHGCPRWSPPESGRGHHRRHDWRAECWCRVRCTPSACARPFPQPQAGALRCSTGAAAGLMAAASTFSRRCWRLKCLRSPTSRPIG